MKVGILTYPKALNQLSICQMVLHNQRLECGLEIMVLVHGMDIQCHKEGGDGLNFYIQASNPRFQDSINIYDESLSDAIESVFPLNTENAILVWNYISKWSAENMEIQSKWEGTVGHLENILNQKSNMQLSKTLFISEWKRVLGIVITGLKSCGYSEDKIQHMAQLIERYESINEEGQLY